jgi:hypothetical protein
MKRYADHQPATILTLTGFELIITAATFLHFSVTYLTGKLRGFSKIWIIGIF